MSFQVSCYVKRQPGPGRRALVSTAVVETFADVAKRAQVMLAEGMEVRILPMGEKP